MSSLKNNIDLNMYKTFYYVAKYNSFSKASEKLYISQPAVSISIKKLEEQLEVTLFKRDNKGIELTEYGKQLLFYVESIINTLNTAEKRLKEDKNLTNGEIKIGVPTHIGIFLLNDIIEGFKNMYPGVKFYIENRSTKDMLNMLAKREIDMIIDNAPLGTDINGVEVTNLMRFDNCFVANRKYEKLSKEIINFKTLNKYQILLPAERTSTRIELEKRVKLENPTLKLQPIIEVSTTEMMLDLVKRGLGIGYFTKMSVADHIVKHELFEIKTSSQLPQTEICLAYIKEFLSNASNMFINYTKNEIKKKKIRADKELRIILTQKCKYKCAFCHKEGLKRNVEEKLTHNHLTKLFKFLNNTYNITSIHFTGGEPFLNENIETIINELRKEQAKITITSNGYSINPNSEIFEQIEKINISIHSIDESEYESISNVPGSYKKAISNIKELRNNYPLLKIEINTTLTKKITDNKEELIDLINFSKSIKANLKIIELFPNTDKINFVSIDKIKPLLENLNYQLKEKKFRKTTYETDDHKVILTKCTCSEAHQYKESGKACYENNDLYLSMDGNLNICRANDKTVSIYEELENNDYLKLKKKIETYFELLGDKCIYDEVNKNE